MASRAHMFTSVGGEATLTSVQATDTWRISRAIFLIVDRLEYRGKINLSRYHIMKQRSLFAFCIILVLAVFAAAQSRTVTNADLEKYREARLNNEREYRENYERLGLPSPEEIDRRRVQSFKETEELSAKLRAERLESERIDAERQTNERLAASAYTYDRAALEPRYYQPSYFYTYGFPQRRRARTGYAQPGYFAGGQFWPTGPTTKPRPMFRVRRSR